MSPATTTGRALAMAALLSCIPCCGYEKKVTKRSECSLGDLDDTGERIVFARWLERYRKPVGLYRFPDGGQPKMLEDSLEIIIRDMQTGETREMEAMGDPRSPLDVHFSWKADRIVYRVENAYAPEDAANGICLVDLHEGRHEMICASGRRPELSPGADRIAYIESDDLWVMDLHGEKAERLWTPPERIELVHVQWDEERSMDLHVRTDEGFEVLRLDLESGEASPVDAPYAVRFGMTAVPASVCPD